MRAFLLLITSFFVISGFSQEAEKTIKNSQVYFSWGYTRVAYSKSSIHFQNLSARENDVTHKTDYYDFTVHNVTAHDRPDFNAIPDIGDFTIPQFVCRVGYYFSDKWALELNYDHAKYVVDDYQTARVSGQFNNNWVDQDTVLDPTTFLHFEHTDGANFLLANLVRKWKLYEPSKHFQTSWVLKGGAGIVIPRTDVTLFGQNLNNDWKIAGYIVGVESGLRLEFLKYGMFELVAKGSFANYVNSFVLGYGNGKASHHFFAGQVTATIGLKFGN